MMGVSTEDNMPDQVSPITARVAISGILEWRDAEGNIIKTTELKGSLPLVNLSEPEGTQDASDDRE